MGKKSKSLSVNRLWPKVRSWLWPAAIWKRVIILAAAVLVLFTLSQYIVAEWYIHKHNSETLVLGTTFIPDYAQSYGLDPQQTLQAILEPASQDGLGMKQLRLVSYWSEVEPQP